MFLPRSVQITVMVVIEVITIRVKSKQQKQQQIFSRMLDRGQENGLWKLGFCLACNSTCLMENETSLPMCI